MERVYLKTTVLALCQYYDNIESFVLPEENMDREFVLKAIEQTINHNSIRMRVTLPERNPEFVNYLVALIKNQMVSMSKGDVERLVSVSETSNFGEKGRKFVITMTPQFDPTFFARTAPHFLEHIEVGTR